MKFFTALLSLAAIATATDLAEREPMPEGAFIVPGEIAPRAANHRDKWGCDKPQYRRKVHIRASKNDKDDLSADFLWAIKQANHGGTVVLEKGKTYIIGKKLDLSFLNDVHVNLEGELKFTDDIKYWQNK